MEQLITTLPAILQASGASEAVIEAAAIAAWRHVAGEQMSKHATATSLEGKTLRITVSDVIWQTQLTSMRGQLLFRLNSLLRRPLVNRLEFRIDNRIAESNAAGLKRRIQSKEVEQTEVSLELWTAAASINDKSLRRAFLQAAASNLRRNERES